MLRPPAQWWSRKPRQPKTRSSVRLKLLAPQPSGMSRPGEPPRLSHSRRNMAMSCRTCRSKSSERRVEVKPTSSLPARLPCAPVHQRSRVLWLLPTTFYWGRPLHHPHSSCCKGLPQWKNSPLHPLLPHQCQSSLLGPKDGTLPQILWRVYLWAEPL